MAAKLDGLFQPSPFGHRQSAVTRAKGVLWLAIAVILGFWAQRSLSVERFLLDGGLLYTLAVAALLRGVSRLKPPGLNGVEDSVTETVAHAGSSRPRWNLATAAVIFGVATFIGSGQNQFRPSLVLAWGLSVVLFVAAFWQTDHRLFARLRDRLIALLDGQWQARLGMTGMALLAVLALAAFYRYYQLASIPAEMTSDHAEKLLDVKDILDGQARIFFPRNTGREPLQFYVTAALSGLVGLNHLALKIGTATFSLLSVVGTFLLAREMFGTRVGLAAAFLEAVSKWAILIGRVGLRFPLHPAFVGLSLLFVYRGLRRGTRNDFLLCGLLMGIGLLGYSPFRVVPLLIAGLVSLQLLASWRSDTPVRPLLANTLLSFSAMLLVFMPLLRYMLDHPDVFWFRAATRLADTERPLPGNPLVILAGNLVNSLLMFNWRGDVVWVNNVPFDPALDPLTGALFVLGAALMVRGLLRGGDGRAVFLLVSLVTLLLPSALSLAFPGENPSNVRSGGAIPVVFTIAALPLALAIGTAWDLAKGAGRLLPVGLALVMVALIAGANYQSYFVEYDAQFRANAWNSSEMAQAIRDFTQLGGSPQAAFIKSWPHWVDTRNVAINLGDITWNNVLFTPEDLARHPAPSGPKLYILHPADAEGLAALRQRFPQGLVSVYPSRSKGKEFVVYWVPDPAPVILSVR